LNRDDAYPLAIEDCLPAPGQGALGVEILSDSPVAALLEKLLDRNVARCVEAERGISAGLGADCALPVAAYAKANAEGEIYLQALVAESDGSAILRADGRGDNPQALAQSVVGKLLDQGAQTILDNARHD
jgi:hydroxymethylbilane synthase